MIALFHPLPKRQTAVKQDMSFTWIAGSTCLKYIQSYMEAFINALLMMMAFGSSQMKWHKFHPKYQRNSEINWNKWYWKPQIIWKSDRFQLIIFWFVCCGVLSLWRANRVLMHGICRHSWRHPGVRVALIIPYIWKNNPMKWLVKKNGIPFLWVASWFCAIRFLLS